MHLIFAWEKVGIRLFTRKSSTSPKIETHRLPPSLQQLQEHPRRRRFLGARRSDPPSARSLSSCELSEMPGCLRDLLFQPISHLRGVLRPSEAAPGSSPKNSIVWSDRCFAAPLDTVFPTCEPRNFLVADSLRSSVSDLAIRRAMWPFSVFHTNKVIRKFALQVYMQAKRGLPRNVLRLAFYLKAGYGQKKIFFA